MSRMDALRLIPGSGKNTEWEDAMKMKTATIGTALVLSGLLSIMAVVPQLMFAQGGKGLELYNAWQFKESEEVFREAANANPSNLEAGYYLGLSILMQDRSAEALEILMKVKEAKDKAAGQATSTVPDEYQIQMALAQAHLKLKQNDQAWNNLESAGKAHEDAADIHVYRGVYYLNKENVKKATQELEKAMKMDEDNAYAHYYAGHAYLRSGNPAKAVEMYKTFLQLAPMAPEAVMTKALITALC